MRLDGTKNAHGGGNSEGAGTLAALVPRSYENLRGLARALLRHHHSRAGFRETSLVHETYLKLARGQRRTFKNDGHFFQIAAHAMRRVIVDELRRRTARKRGGDRNVLELETLGDLAITVDEQPFDILALDEALARLARVDPYRARIVELRYFAGLNVGEVAEVLQVSSASVKRAWPLARAFLHLELRPGLGSREGQDP